MGMVFQQLNLFPHMTVLENLIEAPVQVKKMKPEQIILRQRVCWIRWVCSPKKMCSLRALRGAATAGGDCAGFGDESGYYVV